VLNLVLWELAKLVQLKRVEIDLDSADFTRIFARVRVWPLDLTTCRCSTELDFQSDPADEIIAATSIVHGVPLLTRDRTIRGSRLVPLALGRAAPVRKRNGGDLAYPEWPSNQP
jgi:PIN domain nuclease of toxin-antitoxin system